MNDEVREPGSIAQDLLTTIVDNSGVSRAKLLPAQRLGSVAKRGIGLSPAFARICVDDSISEGASPVGDMRLVPDLNAAVEIGNGLLWAPADQLDQDLTPMPTCQRSAVRRLEGDARSQGLDYLMAFEFEFTVFSAVPSAAEPPFAHEGPAYGLAAFIALEEFMVELLHSLEAAGVVVEQVHPEYGLGQVELSVAPTSAVKAADTAVLVRLIAHRVSRRFGLRVSFAPITRANGIGNGAHVHFSAKSDKGNVFANGDGPFGMKPEGMQMIAGLHERLPSITALLAPSVLSFDRLAPGMWSGAWSCWGLENREAALRFIMGTSGHGESSANCEVKIIDPAANPYLAVAAILAATQDGRDNKTRLRPAVAADPSATPENERESRGIDLLPDSLGHALDLLSKDSVIRAALGDEAVDSFVAVHSTEDAKYGRLELWERIELLRWKY